MVFVDTGAWFALSVPSDANHAAAVAFLATNQEPLVTSDYIYDELMTLFRQRRQPARAALWLAELRLGRAELVWVTQADVEAATDVYFRFHDKGWSFTDCVSRVIMERLRIASAFSFDQHFLQFGTVAVLP
jgi:predicted nucleic acid-binding protein